MKVGRLVSGRVSAVEAGIDNLQSSLTVEVTAKCEDTRLASLRAAVSEAAATRTPIVQLANRIGGWFVAIVLLLAAVTAVAWSWIDPSQVVGNSVALLIVACPCALALATPLAVAVAIGRLAKRRVLVRAGDCLERLSRPGTIFFDKTGTLTQGTMNVTSWVGDSSILAAVAAIQSGIRHPIASALLAHCNSDDSGEATDVRQWPGLGVSGTVGGVDYLIGNTSLMAEHGIEVGAWQRDVDQVASFAETPVVIAKQGKVVAMCGISDPLRDDAMEVVQYFVDRGWKVGILSGDDARTVEKVGERLGLSNEQCRGGLLPEQKLAAVHDVSGSGPVVMVGDGVNDAAALAAADVGVAVRGGASASLTAAPRDDWRRETGLRSSRSCRPPLRRGRASSATLSCRLDTTCLQSCWR